MDRGTKVAFSEVHPPVEPNHSVRVGNRVACSDLDGIWTVLSIHGGWAGIQKDGTMVARQTGKLRVEE